MEAQFTKIETNLKTSSIETELLIGSIRAAKNQRLRNRDF